MHENIKLNPLSLAYLPLVGWPWTHFYLPETPSVNENDYSFILRLMWQWVTYGMFLTHYLLYGKCPIIVSNWHCVGGAGHTDKQKTEPLPSYRPREPRQYAGGTRRGKKGGMGWRMLQGGNISGGVWKMTRHFGENDKGSTEEHSDRSNSLYKAMCGKAWLIQRNCKRSLVELDYS